MAAVLIAELTSDGISTDSKGARKGKRRWLVSTGFGDNATVAAGAVPVVRFDSWPTDTGLMAQGAQAQPVGDGTLGLWHVTVDYDSEIEEKQGTNDTNDPASSDQSRPADQRPWVISYDDITMTEILGPTDKNPNIVDEDGVTGKPVCASNGEFFQGIEIPSSHLIINIKGFKPLTVDPVQHHQTYYNHVNSQPWGFNNTRYAARTLRVVKDSWQSVFDNGLFFYEFHISLEVKWDGWNPLLVVDRGTWEKVSENQPIRPIMIDGQPIKEPVNLKDGVRWNGKPQYLEFQPYHEVSFQNMI